MPTCCESCSIDVNRLARGGTIKKYKETVDKRKVIAAQATDNVASDTVGRLGPHELLLDVHLPSAVPG